MKSLVRIALILCASTLYAQQSTSDWRHIGMTSGSDESYVFYDANGVRKLANGHLEVWLKALPIEATNKEADKVSKDKTHIENVRKKIAEAGLEKTLTDDEFMASVLWEEVANEANIQPTMRRLEEVDCVDRLTRDLSLQAHDISIEKTGQWTHIAPETIMSRLHAALCH